MIWKSLNQNDRYEVSNTGLVRRIDSGHILQGCITNSGYRSVKLTFSNGTQRRFYVHRLVAEHFIENDDKEHKTVVNHKDGNKMNNDANNLEWLTPRENNLHYYREIQQEKKEKKRHNNQPIPVIQLDLYDNEIQRFESISAAHRATGISIVQIKRCLDGEITHTGEYHWKKQQ